MCAAQFQERSAIYSRSVFHLPAGNIANAVRIQNENLLSQYEIILLIMKFSRCAESEIKFAYVPQHIHASVISYAAGDFTCLGKLLNRLASKRFSGW